MASDDSNLYNIVTWLFLLLIIFQVFDISDQRLIIKPNQIENFLRVHRTSRVREQWFKLYLLCSHIFHLASQLVLQMCMNHDVSTRRSCQLWRSILRFRVVNNGFTKRRYCDLTESWSIRSAKMTWKDRLKGRF